MTIAVVPVTVCLSNGECEMPNDTYRIHTDPKNRKQSIGCIDIVKSEDDDGWYAHEYDFTRSDNATRVSAKIYPTKAELVRDLDAYGVHVWGKWE